jgi:hypothetical protein
MGEIPGNGMRGNQRRMAAQRSRAILEATNSPYPRSLDWLAAGWRVSQVLTPPNLIDERYLMGRATSYARATSGFRLLPRM